MDRPKLLIVEDDPVIAHVLARLLERDGYLVTEVHSAADAEAALAVEVPAVALIDLMLPDRDGSSILKYIRAGGLPCRAVIHTAMSRDDPRVLDLRDALRPDAIVFKPATYEELMCALRGGDRHP